MGDRPLRLFASALPSLGAELALDQAAARHARVWRLGEGSELELFDGQGGLAQARVTELTRTRLGCEVTHLERHVPPSWRLHLLLGLTRGEKPDLVVRMATELGVTRVVLVECERSVARGRPTGGRTARLELIAREACAQCGRLFLPQVEAPLPFSRVISQLPEMQPSHMRLVFHERATVGVPATMTGIEDLWALVGPEGGLSSAEIQVLRSAHFSVVHLHTPILRAETAAVVAVARLVERLSAG